jgi:hypothetical protein
MVVFRYIRSFIFKFRFKNRKNFCLFPQAEEFFFLPSTFVINGRNVFSLELSDINFFVLINVAKVFSLMRISKCIRALKNFELIDNESQKNEDKRLVKMKETNNETIEKLEKKFKR